MMEMFQTGSEIRELWFFILWKKVMCDLWSIISEIFVFGKFEESLSLFLLFSGLQWKAKAWKERKLNTYKSKMGQSNPHNNSKQ